MKTHSNFYKTITGHLKMHKNCIITYIIFHVIVLCVLPLYRITHSLSKKITSPPLPLLLSHARTYTSQYMLNQMIKSNAIIDIKNRSKSNVVEFEICLLLCMCSHLDSHTHIAVHHVMYYFIGLIHCNN